MLIKRALEPCRWLDIAFSLAACVTLPCWAQAPAAAAPPATAASAAPAPTRTAPAEPRFTIRRFELEGAERVAAIKLQSALQPLTGPGKRFSDIEAALQVVRDVYEKAGITAMQVLLPEQALEDGVVRLKVEELKVKQVETNGAKARSEANVRRAVPVLREGTTPVDTELSDALRLANENPGRQMQVTFRTEDDGSLTGVLRVADRPPWSVQLTGDNTGNATTGKWRVAAAVQHSNVLDRDIVGSLQVQTSPGFENKVRVGSASARVPIYPAALLLDVSAVQSSVDSGTVKTSAGDYLLSSVGTSGSLKLTRLLPRWGAFEPRASIGWDWRHVDSQVTSTAGGPSLVPDIVLRPVTLSYTVSWKDEALGRGAFGNASWSRNLPGSGRSAASVFAEPGLRAQSRPEYQIIRLGLGGSMAVGSMTLIAQWSGQWTEDALVPAEQFGVGGDGSVRGFNGRVASGDKGQRIGFELASDYKALKWGPLSDLAWAWQASAEAGQVLRNLAQPSEKVRTTLSSLGAGLRLVWRDRTTLRADVGVVARGDGLAAPGDTFVHVNLGHSF